MHPFLHILPFLSIAFDRPANPDEENWLPHFYPIVRFRSSYVFVFFPSNRNKRFSKILLVHERHTNVVCAERNTHKNRVQQIIENVLVKSLAEEMPTRAITVTDCTISYVYSPCKPWAPPIFLHHIYLSSIHRFLGLWFPSPVPRQRKQRKNLAGGIETQRKSHMYPIAKWGARHI